MQGSKHSTPSLAKDIAELTRSLHEHGVYVREPGRVIDGPKREVPNIVTAGLAQLSKPLADYNSAFEQLKARRRMTPLIGGPERPGTPSRIVSAAIEQHSPCVPANTGYDAERDISQPHEHNSPPPDLEDALWAQFDQEFEEFGQYGGFSLQDAEDVSLDMDA